MQALICGVNSMLGTEDGLAAFESAFKELTGSGDGEGEAEAAVLTSGMLGELLARLLLPNECAPWEREVFLAMLTLQQQAGLSMEEVKRQLAETASALEDVIEADHQMATMGRCGDHWDASRLIAWLVPSPVYWFFPGRQMEVSPPFSLLGMRKARGCMPGEATRGASKRDCYSGCF